MAGDQGPILNTCCCGCTLKTGTLTIGWLYLIGSLTSLGGGHQPDIPVEYDPEDQEIHNFLDRMTPYFIPLVVLNVIQGLAAILLLVGANKGRRCPIRLWLVAEAIIMIARGIIFIILTVINFSADDTAAGIIFMVALLLDSALSLYFYLVVYSFYQTLEEGNEVPVEEGNEAPVK